MENRSTEQDLSMKLIWVHPLAAMKGGERQIHDKKLLMFGFFHTLKADSL
jgi:hypothetical protein